MGLKERRALADFQTNKYPEIERSIREAAGFDVAIEVDWDSLALEGSAHLYDECFPEIYFKPLVEAFKSITSDDMGREALKASLKKIQIKNRSEIFSYGRMATFADGLLTLDHLPTSNVHDTEGRRKAIQNLLEDSL